MEPIHITNWRGTTYQVVRDGEPLRPQTPEEAAVAKLIHASDLQRMVHEAGEVPCQCAGCMFEQWKAAVIDEMRRDEWSEHAIEGVDWSAWRPGFDDGYSPRNALNEEYAAAQ